MEKKIKLHEVEQWTGTEGDQAKLVFYGAKGADGVVFGLLPEGEKTLLKAVPRRYRQRYCFDGAWILDPEEELKPFYAVRLHPDCVLVDDVTESRKGAGEAYARSGQGNIDQAGEWQPTTVALTADASPTIRQQYKMSALAMFDMDSFGALTGNDGALNVVFSTISFMAAKIADAMVAEDDDYNEKGQA